MYTYVHVCILPIAWLRVQRTPAESSGGTDLALVNDFWLKTCFQLVCFFSFVLRSNLGGIEQFHFFGKGCPHTFSGALANCYLPAAVAARFLHMGSDGHKWVTHSEIRGWSRYLLVVEGRCA